MIVIDHSVGGIFPYLSFTFGLQGIFSVQKCKEKVSLYFYRSLYGGYKTKG